MGDTAGEEAGLGADPAAHAHGAGDDRIPLDAPAAEHDPSRAAQVRDLASAAMAMDEAAMTGAVRAALRQDGVASAWDQVLAPVLIGVGRKHAATGAYVEVEHLLSAVVSRCLVAVPQPEASFPGGQGRRPVLLACAPEEQHSLPLLALAAALSEAGAARLMLGARVPPSALAAAVERAGAHSVFVWSQTSETGDPSWLAGLPATRPPLRIVVGGPGWDTGRIPSGVFFAPSLPAALDALRVVGQS
jgi:hypothetical protein